MERDVVFPGESETARLGRSMDWSATSLGPVDGWAPAVRTAVQMMLESPFPINLWCGRDLILIYNDAYSGVLGSKHPLAFGHCGKEVWSEIWPTIGGWFDEIRAGGQSVYAEDAKFLMERIGDEPAEAWFTFSLSPVRDERGNVVAFLNVVSETTAHIRAQREVQLLWHESETARAEAESSEARYRFLANAIPVQVWTATPDGSLDYVSDRTAAYFGKQPADFLGPRWLMALHPEDQPTAIRRWKHSLETGAPYENEVRLWSAAHEGYRWHLVRATAQPDNEGRVIRWFGTNTDIEDWKRAEAELKRLTAEATDANRAKSDFLAAMSHELRTPLNAIGGYAQLIELGVRGPVTAQQRLDLAKIQRSKDHLDSLVGDVLNFAKLGAGRVEFNIEEIDVRETVDAVLDMVAQQIAEKGLDLNATIPPSGLTMVADVDKTRQILINLVANALKFTPAGGTIALDVKTVGRDVAISVSDTGIGVPAELLERIFEPFVQAKRSLDPGDHGVGLGLAISRQLASSMDGDLTVVSSVGNGSTFTLTLPLRTR